MRIRILQGDITAQEVDAIVNAANSSLLGGSGVDGAIHRAAGPELLEQCKKLRATTVRDGLPVGSAVATEAGRLPATWVIHTVGPNRRMGQVDSRLLASAFSESLDAAAALGAESVAFPAISAGIFGWDPREVGEVAASVVARDRWPDIEEVRFVLFSDEILAAFRAAFDGAGIPYDD
ncbi:MAG TPA: O-acetyl-ADP-ribose deacetylase [Actinomycetaceae bacterium]|nr:O-acetyl-ADP-ribose deacetylase [Actinomycetaceae bacterium]